MLTQIIQMENLISQHLFFFLNYGSCLVCSKDNHHVSPVLSSLVSSCVENELSLFFCFLYSIYFIETHMHDFTSSHLLNEPSSLKCPAILLRCKPSVRAFTLGSPPKTESCIFRKVFRGAIHHSPNSQQNDYYR